jgi:hypothetical protein
MAVIDNFKEGEFAVFWLKAAEKVSMLVVYSGDQ